MAGTDNSDQLVEEINIMESILMDFKLESLIPEFASEKIEPEKVAELSDEVLSRFGPGAITRSVQLPYSLCETAFSQVSLFLDKLFPRIGFQ